MELYFYDKKKKGLLQLIERKSKFTEQLETLSNFNLS